jgi:RNA polymerase sigma-70 factor (sigma-E family)
VRHSQHAGEFTEFASVVAPRLFRSALLLCGDWQLAEDLVQIALAKLFLAWRRVSGADSPEAYAHGVLTKTFLSHKRVRRNAETPAADVTEAIGTNDDETAAARIDLFVALARLDKIDRAIVVLRYWEDASVAETARRLGMSEGAVRTRSSRALPKLRAALAPAEEAR